MRLSFVIRTLGPVVLPFLLQACTNAPTLVRIPKQTIEGNELPAPPEFVAPVQACGASPISETFDLQPSAVQGANIVFLIDDSSSMGDEIKKVVDQTQFFLEKLKKITNGEFRIVLIFDENDDAFTEKTSPFAGLGNPFKSVVDDRQISYINERTWSHWADAAFFYAFGQPHFHQGLSGIAPLDEPRDTTNAGVSTQVRFRDLSAKSITTCEDPGEYFRPRVYMPSGFSTVGHPTYSGCLREEHRYDIRNYLIAHRDVHIVAISDDDLDVGFNTAGYDPNDPSKRSYPEVIYKMFDSIVKDLGDDTRFIYHSIVSIADGPGSTPEQRFGLRHLALSQKTGGTITDIKSPSYQSALSRIADNIIFSDQAVALACDIPADVKPKVILEGHELSENEYSIVNNGRSIRINANVFKPEHRDQHLQLKVTY